MNLLVPLLVLLVVGVCAVQAQETPVTLPDGPHPLLACTAEELTRLRAAYAGTGAAQRAVAEMVTRGDAAVAEPLVFPPRGGQHNQWYQCKTCEMGLKTLDATRHQCPKCGKIYSGPPYDDVLFKDVHNHNCSRALAAAMAYAITQKPAYAAFTKQVLLGYAERYAQYPYHNNRLGTDGVDGGHMGEQTLGEASSMAQAIAPAYDLIYDTLTPAEHTSVQHGLLRPLLENLDRNKKGKSNWQSWHNAAMITAGIMLQDPAWVRKALYQPKQGFFYQLEASVTKEGMWYENSWGYHFYTLSALTITANAARRVGVDAWADPRLVAMFTLPAHYTLPDGLLPRFGDDVGTTAMKSNNDLEAAYQATRQPALLALLPETPTFASVRYGRQPQPGAPKPALGSEVFPGAGHAILRGGSAAGLTTVLAFGPFGGSHGHFDKLSFVLYGYGQELGVDRGRAQSQAYRLPIHAQWYRATLSHNTVVVDRKSQQGVEGTLVNFTSTADFAAVTARLEKGYPGVQHLRTLLQRPGYLLILDELTADKPHRYDWVYHNRGERAVCPAAQAPATADPAYPGMSYLLNLQTGQTDAPIAVRFDGKAVTTHLRLAGAPASRVLIGDGPGSSVLERIPLAMITREGPTAHFAAVLEPVPTGHTPRVTAVHVEPAGPGLQIRVHLGDREEIFYRAQDGSVRLAK